MSENLNAAFLALRGNECDISADLADSMRQLENPHYRIAVIGKFQVGKSTLINRVFLGGDSLLVEEGVAKGPESAGSGGMDELEAFMSSAKPALIEGDGICTTSVSTEVCYGKQPTLEVYPWKVRTDTVGTSEGEKTVTVREEPGAPDIIVHPTPQDLRQATTAGDSGARLAKAQSTALVRLLWPERTLEKYNLIDTPGIDDPIPEIINTTTYRVLPSADTAILILEPRSLDRMEVDFLRSRVFEAGLVRILALISYKPDAKKLGAGARNDIMAAIRAQLKSIGRESIPVEMYCFDPSVDGAILNSPDRIRARLLEYLDQNVDAARRDKAAHLLRAALRTAILQLRTAEAALKKSETERREIARKIEKSVTECDAGFKDLIGGVIGGLEDIGRNAKHKLRTELSEAMLRRSKELDACSSFAQVQQGIKNINVGLQRDVEQCFFDIGADMKKSVKVLAEQYGDRAALVAAPVRDTMTAELQLDGGMLAMIPDTLLTIADIVIPILIMPTPWFIDIFIRHFMEKSETLSKFLPAKIVVNLVIGNVKGKLISQQEEILSMIGGKLDEAVNDAKEKTRKALEHAWREETEAIRAGLDVKGSANAEAEANRIVKARTELEQAMRGLESN